MRAATESQMDYLEKLRPWLATYSPDAAREADDIWDGENYELDISEAAEAIDAFLDAIEDYKAGGRWSKK